MYTNKTMLKKNYAPFWFPSTGKSRSPPSSPEAVEYGRPSFEGGYASLQHIAIPGKPPSFSIMLPAKLEVHEGERLRLDCSVQGFPTPIGQFFVYLWVS